MNYMNEITKKSKSFHQKEIKSEAKSISNKLRLSPIDPN